MCSISLPIPSMFGIFTYSYHKNELNVGKYTIHGWYGLWIPIIHTIVFAGCSSRGPLSKGTLSQPHDITFHQWWFSIGETSKKKDTIIAVVCESPSVHSEIMYNIALNIVVDLLNWWWIMWLMTVLLLAIELKYYWFYFVIVFTCYEGSQRLEFLKRLRVLGRKCKCFFTMLCHLNS